MNGLNNGLYDGLNNGLHNGLFDGNLNGLHNGLNSSDIGYDVDAYKFINQAVITSQLQRNAINYLVKGLKSFNLWSKMIAIYPFIGGTSSTHKWNLKDPRDLNAAFRLSFSGGWTHTDNGAKPNGTNGYANTFLIGSSSLQLNNTHLSIYSRTNASTNQVDIGANTQIIPQPQDYIVLQLRVTNTGYFLVNQQALSTFTNNNSIGYYIATRTANNSIKGYKNGNKVLDTTTVSTNLISVSIYIGAMNQTSGIAALYSTKEFSFASIGSGLSEVDSINLNNIVQQYQSLLSRQLIQ